MSHLKEHSQSEEPFGIVIGTCAFDYRFAKGTLASIRHFIGDVPVCFLVDGYLPNPQPEEFEGVRVFRSSNIVHPELKKVSTGLGMPKMALFWEGPFEDFVFLDADTIIWGDISKKLQSYNTDFVFDAHPQKWSKNEINQWFFNPDKIKKLDPEFTIENPYANTGVWYGKKGLFDLDYYLKLVKLRNDDSTLFKMGEQGMLNYLIFRGVQRKELTFASTKIQVIACDETKSTLINSFKTKLNKELINYTEAVVLHWPGPKKPDLHRHIIFRAPMTFFRRKSLQKIKSNTKPAALLLWLEDYCFGHLLSGKVSARIQKVLAPRLKRWFFKFSNV